MSLLVKIALILVIGLLFAMAIVIWIGALKKIRMASVIAGKFKNKQIMFQDTGAYILGPRAPGTRQEHGKGVLLLTKDELWFHRSKSPVLEISIPLNQTKDIGLKKAQSDQPVGTLLLYLTYQNDAGEDSVAFLVQYPDKWIEALEEATGRPSNQTVQLPST